MRAKTGKKKKKTFQKIFAFFSSCNAAVHQKNKTYSHKNLNK